MKDSKENKDNLSKIRQCIAQGEPLTDSLNKTVIRGKREACFTVMGAIAPLHETMKVHYSTGARCLRGAIAPIPEIIEEHDVTESTGIHAEESEVAGTTAEIPDSGIDHKV
jgi:hypothetical protein